PVRHQSGSQVIERFRVLRFQFESLPKLFDGGGRLPGPAERESVIVVGLSRLRIPFDGSLQDEGRVLKLAALESSYAVAQQIPIPFRHAEQQHRKGREYPDRPHVTRIYALPIAAA